MVPQQLEKYKKHVDAAILGYLNLLDKKELLAFSIKQHESLSTLDPNVLKGIKTIQDALYATLIIEVHSWVFDKSNSLSIYKLLDKFKNINFNVKHLENSYIRPPITVDIGGKNDSWDEDFKNERKANLGLELEICSLQIRKLLDSEEGKRICVVRDKFLAHKDLTYDTLLEPPTIGDLLYLIDNTKEILIKLSDLILRTYYPFSESQASAELMAQAFWQQFVAANKVN